MGLNLCSNIERNCILYILILLFKLELLITINVIATEVHKTAYDVRALEKTTVKLPCDISIIPEAGSKYKNSTHNLRDDVILVLWYREDTNRPIYSFDARDGLFQQAERWSNENIFGNRAYFHFNSHLGLLTVENAQKIDEGIYRCRVDFKIAQTRYSKVNLTIIVPPSEPKIFDETGLHRVLHIGPYFEGSSLNLRCLTTGGFPQPNVTWYKNGKLIGTKSFIFNSSTVVSDVSITNLKRSDLNAELTCEATNFEGSPPQATTAHIDMNFDPLEVSILSKSSKLTAGKRVEVLCHSIGSRPPAHLSWWLNGERLEDVKESISKDGNTTMSSLSFVPHKKHSGKELMCKSENPVINTRFIDDDWILQIFYVPECVLRLGSSLRSDYIVEGSDVYFDCIIDAYPYVSNVHWKHNNKLLSHNISAGIIITNQSLVIQRVNRFSAGNYSCIGRSAEGDGESEKLYLDVLYEPKCRPNQARVIGVAKIENANISCDIDANPKTVSFKWTFNNSAEAIDVPSSKYSNIGTRSIVTYTPMTELDYGTLLCWAENKIGHQKLPCVYHIIAAGRPDSLSNCELHNVSTDSFVLTCKEGFNGGLKQSFVLDLFDSSSNKLFTNMSKESPKFSVLGLSSGLSYSAQVYAVNDKGRSEVMIIPIFTLVSSRKVQARTNASESGFSIQLTDMDKLIILISTVSVLVVLIIIIIISKIYRIRHREKLKKRNASQAFFIFDANEPCDSEGKNPDLIPSDTEDAAGQSLKIQNSTIASISPLISKNLTPPCSSHCSQIVAQCSESNLHSSSSQQFRKYGTLPNTKYVAKATTESCHAPDRNLPNNYQRYCTTISRPHHHPHQVAQQEYVINGRNISVHDVNSYPNSVLCPTHTSTFHSPSNSNVSNYATLNQSQRKILLNRVNHPLIPTMEENIREVTSSSPIYNNENRIESSV